MDERQLLVEIEDIIRTSPALGQMDNDDDATLDWLGRVQATFMDLPTPLSKPIGPAIGGLYDRLTSYTSEVEIRRLLRAARWRLQRNIGGPTGLAVDGGMVFDYFDGVRNVIESARADVLFVDPYLDAEFVTRYIPHIDKSVPVRLLCRERKATLVPAATAYAQQYGHSLEVRSAANFHDRFVLIDKARCFQSGASFKDGAKKAPTTLTEITDTFAAVQQTYEGLWASSTVDFKQ